MRPLLFGNVIAALLLCCCCGQRKTAGDGTGAAPTERHGGTGERGEAPKHNAPDQDRIDSLKQEKLKERNP